MARRKTLLATVAVVLAAVGVLLWWARGAGGEESPGEFVGVAACAQCHQEEYAAWRGSHHDRAMQHARPGAVLADFDSSTYSYGSVTSTFFRRGGRYFVRTDASDGTLRDFEVKYTFGVEPLQQYLIELPNGRVQPLSVAWDSRPEAEGGQRWTHLYPGQGIEHTSELHWTARQQNWNFMCADCHSTNLRKGYDAEADAFRTTWSEIDVGCEACHGPGSRHGDWAGVPGILRTLLWRSNGLTARLDERRGVSWNIDPATRKPTRSVPRATEREVQLCAQCHSRRAQVAEGYVAGAPFHDYYAAATLEPGLYYPDGQQRDEVYVHGSFAQSRMFHAGVTCSDCHDPHTQKLRAPGNQLCGQCHLPTAYDAPSHHRHAAASTGAQCVSCHMPETTYMLVDPRRDHSIRVPRPDQSVSLGVPNACNQCHTDRTADWAARQVRSWHGHDPAGFHSFAEVFHADERGEPEATMGLTRLSNDAAQPAIVRASALARLADRRDANSWDEARVALADPDPTVRRAALGVLEAMPARQRIAAVAPLLDDPSRTVRLQAVWVLAPVNSGLEAEQRASFGRAVEEFIASERYNADRAEARITLGNFFSQLGRTAEAANEYRAAIRLAPTLALPYVNLADLLRASGREADAERTVREGLARVPEDPDLHHSFGLSLVRSGRPAEAVAELERAAALAPDRADLAYAYAVALNSTGREREAIRTLERARVGHPSDRDLLIALSTFHRDLGEMVPAIRYAQLLVQLSPGDSDAQALLGSLQAGVSR